MKFIWVEIWKFIKNNALKISIGILLITGLFVFVTRTNYNDQLESNQEITENTGRVDESGLIVDTNPAVFQFYIENPDGSIFTNNIIIEQFFNLPETLKVASIETNTKLAEIVEETENTAIVDYNNSEETQVIGVGKFSTSHLHEFYVNIGNEADNLRIANFYYDYFNVDNLPFLENKEVYIRMEPSIKDLNEPNASDVTPKPINPEYNLLKNFIIGLIFSVVATFGVALLIAFLSRKLLYSFTYSVKADDYFFLSDHRLNNSKELNYLLNEGINPSTVLISENGISSIENIEAEIDKEISSYRSILEVKNPSDVKRIIYIIEEGITTREWYNNQRRIDEAYNIPTIVLQLNKQ